MPVRKDDRLECRCVKCDSGWQSRKPASDPPIQCPYCKRTGTIEFEIVPGSLCVCAKCGYKWSPRKGAEPRACPRCHKITWNATIEA